MLTHDDAAGRVPGVALTSVLLVVAILTGALLGHNSPAAGQWLGDRVDATLLILVSLLFLGVRPGALRQASARWPVMALILLLNFGLVPLLGYGVASALLPEQPLLMVGLMIYFMSPCTDWFLGFTRLAGGNVALGTALIPLNMVLQLALYPVYLQAFTRHAVQVEAGLTATTLLQWFLLPLLAAMMLRHLLMRLLPDGWSARLLALADRATPWVLALLVLEIFAANIGVILAHRHGFGSVLAAVFVFFVLSFALGEAASRLCRLAYPDHALLTMSLAARNAPLMLAVTMTALPGEALVHAAVVIGMLLEFPHLEGLRRLLLRQRQQRPGSGPSLPGRQRSAQPASRSRWQQAPARRQALARPLCPNAGDDHPRGQVPYPT